ncbi:MAG: chaperone NapD [Rhodospirillales bacterium]
MLEGKQSIISRTRRDFISGKLGKPVAHIASLIIQAWPENLSKVEAALTEISGVESHGDSGPGRLIVTVEVEDDAGLVDAVNRIQFTPGVINASLVYHQIDEGDAE